MNSMFHVCHRVGLLSCLTFAGLFLAADICSAQGTLEPNQTFGFANGRLLKFTYSQSFDCVDEPNLDLDFNGKPAQSDSNEMQTPICQAVTEPQLDPSGAKIKHTSPIYVLVPMFSVDNDTNPDDAMPCPNGGRPGELCGKALGQALISLFGAVPEAWKSKPNAAITTQCPDPANAAPGTCTMHASAVDLSKALLALGKIKGPLTGPIFLPTPNHSHVLDNNDAESPAIWWEVRPVLVLHQSDWPSADGNHGITSAKLMDEAESAGRAIEVGSNFFLFFSSRFASQDQAMLHMHHSNPSQLTGQSTAPAGK